MIQCNSYVHNPALLAFLRLTPCGYILSFDEGSFHCPSPAKVYMNLYDAIWSRGTRDCVDCLQVLYHRPNLYNLCILFNQASKQPKPLAETARSKKACTASPDFFLRSSRDSALSSCWQLWLPTWSASLFHCVCPVGSNAQRAQSAHLSERPLRSWWNQLETWHARIGQRKHHGKPKKPEQKKRHTWSLDLDIEAEVELER